MGVLTVNGRCTISLVEKVDRWTNDTSFLFTYVTVIVSNIGVGHIDYYIVLRLYNVDTDIIAKITSSTKANLGLDTS